MSCEQFSELYELYALGLLEGEELTAFQTHLREGCEVCRAGIIRAQQLNAIISGSVPLVNPSSDLRRRVLATVQPARRHSIFAFASWGALAALLVLLAGALLYQQHARQLDAEVHEADLRTHAADVRTLRTRATQVARLTHVIDMLGAAGTREVPFGNASATAPHGRLFVNPQIGLLLLVNRLTPAPSGSKYEGWIVPASGAPRPISAFAPDETGTAILFVPGPIDPATIKAMAVSREPANLEPTTPTTVLFAAPAI